MSGYNCVLVVIDVFFNEYEVVVDKVLVVVGFFIKINLIYVVYL